MSRKGGQNKPHDLLMTSLSIMWVWKRHSRTLRVFYYRHICRTREDILIHPHAHLRSSRSRVRKTRLVHFRPNSCANPRRTTRLKGNLVFNDVVQQLSVNELPFSGIGESGCTSLLPCPSIPSIPSFPSSSSAQYIPSHPLAPQLRRLPNHEIHLRSLLPPPGLHRCSVRIRAVPRCAVRAIHEGEDEYYCGGE